MITKEILTVIITTALIVQCKAQGLVLQNRQAATDYTIGCGSYDFMQYVDNKRAGYLDLSNKSMMDIEKIISNKNNARYADSIYLIPVVFHIVYNNSSENIPDSVIQNQIKILNDCYRRKNADTTSTRPIFQDIVGDSKIEFVLAATDPEGNPTTGITRTNSEIAYFGGILPYAAGQNQAIRDWVNDSLLYNLFRITNDISGGKSPWDTDKYLNIWIGDLRILEPKIDNFEEIVFFGLSTPPVDHHNWPDSMQAVNIYEQGVILHYVNVGANNPNAFASPYNAYNGLVTTGKMLVHEVGHYLGLRHIWGDAESCSFDDFIYDTPGSNAASPYDCNKTRNTCVDNIYSTDLPDMLENYMDYSSGNCQNSFTVGQITAMRYVLNYYYPNLANIVVIENIEDNQLYQRIQVYPNPTTGAVTIKSKIDIDDFQMNVRSIDGKLVRNTYFIDKNTINFEIEGSKGIYFMEILSDNKRATFKIVKL